MRKIFSLSGSLLLVICFFLLPFGYVIEYIREKNINDMVKEFIQRGNINEIDVFVSLISPHLFGLIVLLSIILFLLIKRVPRIITLSHWGILLLGYGINIINIHLAVKELFNLSFSSNTKDTIELTYIFIAVAFCILIPLVVIRSLKKQTRQGSPQIIITISQKIVALMSFLWFLYWFLFVLIVFKGGAFWGLYLAMISCVLIYLGAPSFTLIPNNRQPIPESLS